MKRLKQNTYLTEEALKAHPSVLDTFLSMDDTLVFLSKKTDHDDWTLDHVFGSFDVFGYTSKQVSKLSDLLAYFDSENAYSEIAGKQEYFAEVKRQLYDFETRPILTFPIKTLRKRSWIRLSKYPMKTTPQSYSIFIQEVTNEMNEKEHIFRKTHLDALTDVFNKYALDYHYGLRYQRDDFHVVFLDLDNFKHVNETKGHPYGNAFLKQFAHLLKQHENEYNRFYRIGGDEFVGLFFMPTDKLLNHAKKLLNDTSNYALNEGFNDVSVSIAVVKADQREDVIRKADALLNQAKAQGKNQILFKNESELV